MCVGLWCAPSKDSPGQSLVWKSRRGRVQTGQEGVTCERIPRFHCTHRIRGQLRNVQALAFSQNTRAPVWALGSTHNDKSLFFLGRWQCRMLPCYCIGWDPGHAWGPCSMFNCQRYGPKPPATPLLIAQGPIETVDSFI